ncbi:MAG: DEAD/DEAH box helicase [Ferrovibrio sp.]
MAQTIQQTIHQLHLSLSDYIEATYHISSPQLVSQRKELLQRPGVISQVPYIESTPRYATERHFSEIPGIPSAALEAYKAVSTPNGSLPRLIYDPPYKHQSDAIQHSLIESRNLVIMTGTGSGKTESFLLPILGKLAREAAKNPSSFKQHSAVRALILYPMNALVNDQLGRMRALFGDPRIVKLFENWAGRPARFSRYTSRTPYAGVRNKDKDQRNLKSFEDYYVDIQRKSERADSSEQKEAADLLLQLKLRGKWPAKPDLVSWFGQKGSLWQDTKSKSFKRAITLDHDVELITRHEAHENPPDLLITNYSMLEYMMMRPIERSIFDQTREWLKENQTEKFLIVLDEAHLYRGAAGAEVGLLLRRLRDRLGIAPERFQVICATASFQDKDYAPHFGAQLAGVPPETFVPIQGHFAFSRYAMPGAEQDAKILSSIDLQPVYGTVNANNAGRSAALKAFLDFRGIAPSERPEVDLYHALKDYPPLGLLINETMKQAKPIRELASEIFPGSHGLADQAVTTLMALGSMARLDEAGPGLLPSRIHSFYRGLPGLWVCMDPCCSEVPENDRTGFSGKLYGQPRERCACGARVFELFTCRYCGTAYARSYTNDVDNPETLWSTPGQAMRMHGGDASTLLPLDLLLEEPRSLDKNEPANFDIESGWLNPPEAGAKVRKVYLRSDRTTPPPDENCDFDQSLEARGMYIPCGCCDKMAKFGRSTVQDHQTKGDQPFQALVAKQIAIQPPSTDQISRFAPLQGRKVLIFSDSRQVAARLAPNLQMYSTRDSLRPLISWGFTRLQNVTTISSLVSLDDLYLAVLVASKKLEVRLRPERRETESFAADDVVDQAVRQGGLDSDETLAELLPQIRSERPPQSLLEDILWTVQDPFLGFEALALASICERRGLTSKLRALPDIPGIATVPDEKVALARAWLRCWRGNGFWLSGMPTTWRNRSRNEGISVKAKRGKGKFNAMDRILLDKPARKIFNEKWLPELLEIFTASEDGGFLLQGTRLSLSFDGEWRRCQTCKSVHRPVSTILHCLDCSSTDVSALDPFADEVFLARKGFYRKPVLAALSDPPTRPFALIAAEHTAQLNSPQSEDVFSKAEENELLFQDIIPVLGKKASKATAIDILSSTTTMEVGIDIGALSGVALRNMPPGRANYQQRAGRAGRRGNSVATVVAFGSVDSHDEYYFSEPDGMIRGAVIDPKLTLDNPEIVRRHIRAFLLQCYHQDRLPEVSPDQSPNLFSVLGDVSSFRDGKSVLNVFDFDKWLTTNEVALRTRVASWIPSELPKPLRDNLLDKMATDCREAVNAAIAFNPERDSEIESAGEEPPEVGEDRPTSPSDSGQLLDRLLYCGILPRYAFPTDVATFHVFDTGRSTSFRTVMKFAPSQGLPVALTQYAPGKQVWISGKCYTSGAIYSVSSAERFRAWENKRLYSECEVCGFARTDEIGTLERGSRQDCPACGQLGTFGEAKYWLRPTGFAHPIDVEEVTSPEDMPEASYATRAKLTMQTPTDADRWVGVNDRIRVLASREHLLVSNTGPKDEGYSYCVKCGRIEASSAKETLLAAEHAKPYPDEKQPKCEGGWTSKHVVLGTDFITDIALFSLEVAKPLQLKPGFYPTDVALRTVSEALAKAASRLLDIEPGELMAEYRPSLTPDGRQGLKAEVFLYDTLPGGAGFSSQLVNRGSRLFSDALALLKNCPDNCDASCYRCLRAFRNKFEHTLLDRHIGAELLSYLISGEIPMFSEGRLNTSADLLYRDLRRQSVLGWSFERPAAGSTFSIPGVILATSENGGQTVISLTGGLVSELGVDRRIAAASGGYIAVNELLVRGNLPAATDQVKEALLGRSH